MGFKLTKSKDKDSSSQVSGYTTKTTGPANAWASKGGTATYAEKGGRAAAVSRNGSAWSKSVAYGGDSYDDKRSPHQVSKREHHTYTSGNAIAGVVNGGTFAYAGPGGYGEAAYRDGSSYGASVAYGGEKKEANKWFDYRDLIPLGESSDQRGRIESHYASSDDEGYDSNK